MRHCTGGQRIIDAVMAGPSVICETGRLKGCSTSTGSHFGESFAVIASPTRAERVMELLPYEVQ